MLYTKKNKCYLLGLNIIYKNIYLETNIIICYMDNIEYSKNRNLYICHYCKYETKLLSLIKQHVNTKKHKRNLNKDNNNVCEYCNKLYSSRISLTNHQRRSCKIKLAESKIKLAESKIKLAELEKEVLEAKIQEVKNEKMEEEIEAIKDGKIPLGNTTINNNITNNTDNKVIVNNHFNLQFYLNDTCKDAINMSEFTKSIEMTMEDLLYIGNNGWAEGMSRIITNNLKKIEAEKRPIQTSDAKRAITYVKDEENWVKDGEANDLISDTIDNLNKEQYKIVGEWSKYNPPTAGTPAADSFHKVLQNLNPGEKKQANVNKVKRSIRTATAIDKNKEN